MRSCAALLLGLAIISGSNACASQSGEVDRLIQQLGSAKFADRQAATTRLQAIGEPAAAALRQAAQSSDPEIRARARELLSKLKGNKPVRSVVGSPSAVRPPLGGLPAPVPGMARPQLAAPWNFPAPQQSVKDSEAATRWRAAYKLWKAGKKTGPEALAEIKKVGARMLERSETLTSPDDVRETQAMLTAALEISARK